MFRTKACVHKQSILFSNFVPTLVLDSVRFRRPIALAIATCSRRNRTGPARDHRSEGGGRVSLGLHLKTKSSLTARTKPLYSRLRNRTGGSNPFPSATQSGVLRNSAT
jgi:hypothetical protein